MVIERKELVMKKIIKIVPFLIAIFITVIFTYSYYSTSDDLPSNFKTINYNFKLNSLDGSYLPSNELIVIGTSAKLPIPTRNGYIFIGYSDSTTEDVIYDSNIDDISKINNKEIFASWQIESYTISYDLNGGSMSDYKSSYNVEESFTLPIPAKTGASFIGWTGSNGDVAELLVNIPKGTTENLSFVANWSNNDYAVDVNPIIDGIKYNSGLDGYTFNVWINDDLVAENVIDWYQYVKYGSRVRVKTNSATGASTNYNEVFTVGTDGLDINPSWSFNTYEAHFYFDGIHRFTTYNKYSSYISTPEVNASDLGYDGNFYYVSGFAPWQTWYQPDYAVGFTINISEYNCSASFGSVSQSNAKAQLTKAKNAGYDFCEVTDWNSIWCTSNYSKVIELYNKSWNIFPRSGSGYSVYKQISCDSGWSTYKRR